MNLANLNAHLPSLGIIGVARSIINLFPIDGWTIPHEPKDVKQQERQVRRLDLSLLPKPQLLLPFDLYLLAHLGNRCHFQTKEQNAYMTQLYQQHLEQAQEQQQIACTQDLNIDSFPNVLLLMINDDPWEEYQYPQRRDGPETLNVKWINNLIEEWFGSF